MHVVDEGRKFDTMKLQPNIRDMSDDLYYERFWTIYVWSAVMADAPYGYSSSLPHFTMSDETATATRVAAIIADSRQIEAIEQDLKRFDEWLAKKRGRNVVVIFDELDNIVKPILWPERVAPLINWCRKMNYKAISPKLFLRSDLFEKITGINNKNELYNRTTNIEWSGEELLAYFFKQIVSLSADDFFSLAQTDPLVGDKAHELRNIIINNDGQPPLEKNVLRPLCCAFFGKYANRDNTDDNNTARWGESYDWFYRNLKNANDTISLRPFIDLITNAVDKAIEEDKTDRPILPPFYYTNMNARIEAVRNHINDLASETGNTDLTPIFEYIHDKAEEKYKKDELGQQDFYCLLNDILTNCNLKDCKDRDSLVLFLEINGVIKHITVRGRQGAEQKYQFAFLYKYYLGLRGKWARHRDRKTGGPVFPIL